MTKQNKAYLLALTAVVFWSTVSTAFKIALLGLNFIQLLFIATLTSFFIFFVYAIVTGKLTVVFKTNLKELSFSALIAFINPIGYYLVLFKAYSLLPAQIAQPLNYTWPLVLTLLSAVFLKQKLTLLTLAAFFISLAAVLVISSQGNLVSLKINSQLGIFLALFSSIFWAGYWILNIKDKREEIAKLFWNFFFASIFITVICVFFSNFDFKFGKSFYAAIYTGFFEIGFTFIVWLNALKFTTSTAKISNMIYLSPALALFFIHFVLREHIFYTTYIGLVLILMSIYILNKKRNKQQSIQ